MSKEEIDIIRQVDNAVLTPDKHIGDFGNTDLWVHLETILRV